MVLPRGLIVSDPKGGTTMFTEGLIVSKGPRKGGRRPAAFTSALAAHVLVVGTLIVIPLLAGSTLPPIPQITAILVPQPPPAPTPPPAAPAGGRQRPTSPPPTQARPPATGLVAPQEIPTEIPEEEIDLGQETCGVDGGVGPESGDGVIGCTGTDPFSPRAGPKEEPPPVIRILPTQRPQPILRVSPIYPPIAAAAGAEGFVVLEATTDVEGRVVDMRILRSHPLFNRAATDAVRQWIYKPYRINGRPHPVVFVVTVEFKLR